ncbi:MAG: 1-(5-phosphoribosyl)-5-[(5-phosphoribosylamino)methylideneamino]imidazole-4-carboxamide isomerase [Candidatus Adiutrix sp.]
MILFPAIDLKDGQCVRLYKGNFAEKTVYGDNPTEVALRWEAEGASWIHLVDLDGSLGDNEANLRALESIRQKVGLKLQLGGGIRNLTTAKKWFDLGLDRLILGTIVCEDPSCAQTICQAYPNAVAVALDAVGSELRVRGWQQAGGCDLFDVAASLKAMGAAALIYTDVERDGTQMGPNIENTRALAKISALPTICSGGIANLDDLAALKPFENEGIMGAISGKALYEGTLDFASGQKFLM